MCDQRTVLEFHDSKIDSIHVSETSLIITLKPAMVHQSQGRAGIDPGTCWTQEARVELMGAQFTGEKCMTPIAISDGTLIANGRSFENCHPVPFRNEGVIEMELVLEDSSVIHAKAEGVRLTLMGEPVFLEHFSGSSDPT